MKSLLFSKNRFFALIAGLCFFVSSTVFADTVKLKTGETLEGKLTYEGSDYIKFEVPISATIKDTKVIPRAEIAEIIKAAPDDVALSELREKLPAPSLMSAQAYRDLLDLGPKKFLTQFPSSGHKAEVEKILSDLEGELDKVERGSLKIEGEWVSAQDKKEYKTLTDARVRSVLMKRKLAQSDMLGALRDFEILDEQFYGTPAHADAIPLIQEMLPAFGQRLTRALQDVEYRNQKWEKDKALLDDVARAQVEAARAQELANFELAVKREQEAGVKWLSINDNSSESLSSAIANLKSEIERLGAVNVAGLKTAAEELVKADKLIAERKLNEARKIINETSSSGSAAPPKKFGSSKKKSSSSKAASGSYAGALLAKIGEVEAAIALNRKQQEESAKGELASSVIKAGENKGPVVGATAGEAAEEGAGPSNQGSALTGLMSSGAKSDEKDKGEKDGKKKPTAKSKAASKKDSDDEKEETPRRVVADEGGGLSFQVIMMIVAGLMVVALGVMKALGIGGAKDGGEG